MFQAFWGASEYPGVSNRGTKRATLYLKAIWRLGHKRQVGLVVVDTWLRSSLLDVWFLCAIFAPLITATEDL